MIQNYVDPYIWKNFKHKTDNIDQLVEWALEKQNKKINDKYISISNTVKILKNLMIQFSKKADNLQKNLLTITRVQQTQTQSYYYQKRISECTVLSEKLKDQIEEKNKKINERIKELNNLKVTLMRLKTQNIKSVMKIQQTYESSIEFQQKQNLRAQKQKRKLKKEEDRKMMTNGFMSVDNSLKQQSNKLEIELFNKIDKVKELRYLIEDCFQTYRQKLKKQEKKSNLYGLAGSMFFKMQTKQDPVFPKIAKQPDSKLIVYDILKQKYRKHKKQQNKRNGRLRITLQQFMNFSPLQILGVVELKGGLKSIINRKLPLTQEAKRPKLRQVQQTNQKAC